MNVRFHACQEPMVDERLLPNISIFICPIEANTFHDMAIAHHDSDGSRILIDSGGMLCFVNLLQESAPQFVCTCIYL